MSKCDTCEHRIFDEIWGEYKCTLFQHRIYKPEEIVECEGYIKEKKKED